MTPNSYPPPAAPGKAEIGLLAALVLFYLATVLPNLGNDPIVGGDEGWIISASEKLAREGVFGSELFAGFYGAEDHYYFNLPLHHVVLAGVFKVFGVGIVQARLVSAMAGLLVLFLTYAFGRRIAGPVAGLGAAALLLLLRLNLTPFTGLTLTDLGAIVRYDLAALVYAMAGALVLVYGLPAPSPGRAAVSGLLVGLGGLTQFLGAFFIAPLALFLLTLGLPWSRRSVLAAAFLVAALLPFIPYGAYALADWDDFRGQARTVEQETDLLSPAFYIDGLKNEPDRYALATGLSGLPDGPRDAVRRPSARLTMYVVGPVAALVVLSRVRRGQLEQRLLLFLLVGLALELALFESTKRFVYWVAVAPFLCMAIAQLGVAVWRWRPRAVAWRLAALGAAAIIGGVFFFEGVGIAARHVRDARSAPDYSTVGARLEGLVPVGSRVIGDNRLWLTLHGRQHRSLLLLFYHTNPRISEERTTNVFGAMERIDADYLLLSPLSREILAKLSPRDSADFAGYLAERGRLLGTVNYPAYGPIEVYELSD